ncbi:MAG: excinuclease ABC subunit UvrA, partial [Clostridiaceae bacterium]|nr:excinuclease ABC subunit UvrA [Clostridiaceae bacterium]
MVDVVMALPEGARIRLMAPMARQKRGTFKRQFEDWRRKGFQRVRVDGADALLSDLDSEIESEREVFELDRNLRHDIEIVVDRLILRPNIVSRLADSIEATLALSEGLLLLEWRETADGELHEQLLSQNYACPDHGSPGIELEPRLFSFNNPLGACPECAGLGSKSFIDPVLVVTDPNVSLNEGAIRTGGWNFDDRRSWGRAYIEALSERYKFSLDTPWKDLPQRIREIILYGNDGEVLTIDTTNSKYNHGEDYRSSFEGVVNSLERRYRESSSEEMREYYEQYMTTRLCERCHGARLNEAALAVTVGGKSISEYTALSIRKGRDFIDGLDLPAGKGRIAQPILREVRARLDFLIEVGLDYLTLSRSAGTLSGGEAQRIRLATQIGSGMMGVLYILDEPSIGLHQRDNARLLGTLMQLRDLGNTVIVVEHDEETIRSADMIIDIGPGAGVKGGEIVAQGTVDDIVRSARSVTGQYLSGARRIPIPERRRKGNGAALEVRGAAHNNLAGADIDFPLGTFICVTGVSGSGKSSLVNGIVYPYLMTEVSRARRHPGAFGEIRNADKIDKVIAIDQSPIGRTPRSNPATYTGVFDIIRQTFAMTPAARARGYKPGRFSFNVRGGRCEACRGNGVNRIEMHFLPDVYVPCDVCKGKRYNRETLEVTFQGKNIAEVLDMTIDEAAEFFADIPRITRLLTTLREVGLGYMKLGQPSTQLSGGEAQRVKLASELSRRSTGNTFYILDEPTTGLHAADVHKLVDILQRFAEQGNTVVVIEHNLDVIKTADYIIDLGPGGGDQGGRLVAAGTPEEVAANPASYTGQYLQRIFAEEAERKKNG